MVTLSDFIHRNKSQKHVKTRFDSWDILELIILYLWYIEQMYILILFISSYISYEEALIFVSSYFQQVKHLGSTIYSSSRDKTIKAWQAHKNDPLLTFEGHRLVVTAIDLNDGKTEIQQLAFKCIIIIVHVS